MTSKDTDSVQPGVRIDATLWEQFKNDIQNRKGVVRGQVAPELENAIENYLTASNGTPTDERLRRIENELESLCESVAPLADATAKKEKHSEFSSRVETRFENVKAQIMREAGDTDLVHDSVIETAIEDNAGFADQTLDRYKGLLKKRLVAFEHPNDGFESWWLDGDSYVAYVEDNYGEADIREIATEYDKEWFNQTLEEVASDRGFQ